MNNSATNLKKLVIASILLIAGIPAWSQVNLASASLGTVVSQSGGGSGAYGPEKYNNDTLLAIGVTSPFADQGYVSNGGWIEFMFTAPASVNKVVFLKELRPVTKATIEAYDATTSSYYTVATYENYVNNTEDSITFAPVTTDRIRINNIVGHSNNPNFREIKIMSAPTGACTGAPTVSAAQARYVAGSVTYLTNNFATTVSTCPGAMVYLSAYNLPNVSGLTFQWNKGGTPIAGATNSTYVFEAFSSGSYTVTVSCGTSSTTSNAVNVTVSPIAWQTVPYIQNFDDPWISSSCVSAPSTADLPGAGWANNPPSGNSSWRRSTQGTGSPAINEGGWTSITTGTYNTPLTPASGLGPGWPTTGYSARFHSSTSLLFNDGNLDLFLNCNTSPAGDKALYFYHMNKASAMNDSLLIYLSTDGGNTFTRLAGWDTAISWRKRWVPIPSNSANTIVRFKATKKGNENTDIGIDSVYIAAPCASGGTLNAGTIAFAAVTNACAGATYTLTTNGTTPAGNLVYQWEFSRDGGTTWNAVGSNCGSGGDGLIFNTPPLYDTTLFRMGVKCGTTGTFVYTNPVTFNITPPEYAPIPFSENFNSTWVALSSNCGTRSVPSVHYANTPATNGNNNSWRRSDDPTGGGWTNPTNGAYTPTGITGQTGDFSARFHSAATPITMNGKLDLFLDLSSYNGDKELHFGYINNNGNDSLQLFFSEDAGCNFSHLGTYYTTTGWEIKTAVIPTNSDQTIIRFQAHGDNGTSDIGLDSLKVIPPCDNAPNAGEIIAGPAPCAGVNFTMNLSGFSQAAGLTYQWYKAIGTNPYAPISGATNTWYTDNILAPTYYYVVVTCNNSSQTDTTPVFLMNVADFYYCFCASHATTTTGADVGNVKIVSLPGNVPKLDNGNASPLNNNPNANKTYSDFRNTIPPVIMYHDSTYAIFVTQINSGAFTQSTVSVWIDTNRNGYFDPNEKFLHEYTSNTSYPEQRVQDTFMMLPSAFVGVTGMRVVLEHDYNSNPVPCSTYPNGETEDYLVEIRYPPCNGPANPGIAYISDTSGCVGYNIMVFDTTHEKQTSDVVWVWQYSPDGNSWGDVPGSLGRDTINHIVTGPVHFRLRVICYQSLDTTYSNTVSLTVNPAVSCYCFSQATGGLTGDSSDIGGVIIKGTHPIPLLDINVGGPHIMNPEAYRARTDYTRVQTTELWIDSTYKFEVFHILKSNVHVDAKLTLFIDYNADLQYNIPHERVWTDYTTSSYFTASTYIQIPSNVIANVPTGMRLIINNDTGPNAASDEGCGTYASGETEDYVVIFRSPITHVPHDKNVTWLNIYPNPSEGRFTVNFLAQRPVDEVTISITNVTGQKVWEQRYDHKDKEFAKELDLSNMAKGVYIVEIKADNDRQIRKLILK